MCFGQHMIKSWSRQQKTIALSSAEAELHAMVAASAETLGAIALCKDLGIDIEGEVYVDSSAALGIAQRAGYGKVRHIRIQSLWVQEVRSTGRLMYKKVLGTLNPSDVLTKHVPADLLTAHLKTLGVEVRGGRADSAPELSQLEVHRQWYYNEQGSEKVEVEVEVEEDLQRLPRGGGNHARKYPPGKDCTGYREAEGTMQEPAVGKEEEAKVIAVSAAGGARRKQTWAEMAEDNSDADVDCCQIEREYYDDGEGDYIKIEAEEKSDVESEREKYVVDDQKYRVLESSLTSARSTCYTSSSTLKGSRPRRRAYRMRNKYVVCSICKYNIYSLRRPNFESGLMVGYHHRSGGALIGRPAVSMYYDISRARRRAPTHLEQTLLLVRLKSCFPHSGLPAVLTDTDCVPRGYSTS